MGDRRAFADPGRCAHPGFQDLTGRKLAGCEVLRRAANVNGNARWRVSDSGGHEFIVEGIKLREAERRGRVLQCRECRPKRRGTVTRKAVPNG